MGDYTAAMRIMRTDDALALFAASTIGTLNGVKEARVDPVSGQVLVRYDRSYISIGDLVRWIEDQGVQVLSVAQQSEAASIARSASA